MLFHIKYTDELLLAEANQESITRRRWVSVFRRSMAGLKRIVKVEPSNQSY